MRLMRFEIENYRCYGDPISFDLRDLTAIIGSNDCGKSSLLDAIEIFFDQAKMDQDDCCKHTVSNDVRFTAHFSNLPASIILDSKVPTSLGSENLLNSNGLLQVTKLYDCSLSAPKEKSLFLSCDHPIIDDGPLIEKTITQLRRISALNDLDMGDVNQTISSEIRAAIRLQMDIPEVEGSVIELKKGEGKKIWEQLSKHLPMFVLFRSDRPSSDKDSEAQEPLSIAVKTATARLEGLFQQVVEAVDEEVRKVAAITLEELSAFDPSLSSVLEPRIKNQELHKLFSVSMVGDDDVPINKRGSGVRRLFLMSFFKAQARINSESEVGRHIVYAIEEPETGQHPENQRMVITALRELSESPNSQVIVTTHSPMLARTLDPDDILFLKKGVDNQRLLNPLNGPADFHEVSRTLGVLPDHDVRLFICVEGTNDIAFLKGISSALLADGDTSIPDIIYYEQTEKVIFNPLGGSSLVHSICKYSALNIPEIYLFDRDHEPPAPPKYQDAMARVEAEPLATLFCTEKMEMENYLHPQAIVGYYNDNGNNLKIEEVYEDFADVPLEVSMRLHAISESDRPWEDFGSDEIKSKVSGVKKRLNRECTFRMTRQMLDEVDPDGEVIRWLTAIKEAVEPNPS